MSHAANANAVCTKMRTRLHSEVNGIHTAIDGRCRTNCVLYLPIYLCVDAVERKNPASDETHATAVIGRSD